MFIRFQKSQRTMIGYIHHLDKFIKEQLNSSLNNIAEYFNSDVLTIYSPINYGLESLVKNEIENVNAKKEILTIILQTNGGVVEVVERMVKIIRYHYNEVYFIVPNTAMSAGTVFVMSGDKIYMNYFSSLGPIDPQIPNSQGKLIPVKGYLNKYNEFIQKSKDNQLSSLEYSLIQQMDLAELEFYANALKLSEDLLIDWLSKYKFKDWMTNSEGNLIDIDYKKSRAKEIAIKLNNIDDWHSHSRNIGIEQLTELKIKIDDYSIDYKLKNFVDSYFNLLDDYMLKTQGSTFVQINSKEIYGK